MRDEKGRESFVSGRRKKVSDFVQKKNTSKKVLEGEAVLIVG